MKQFSLIYKGVGVGSVFADRVEIEPWPDHPGWSSVHAIARGEVVFAGQDSPYFTLRLEPAPRANARPDATSSAEKSHNDKERKE